MRFIVATHNQDKLKEIKEILQDFPFEVSDLSSLGYHEEIVEDGKTFAENACIKVNAIAQLYPDDYIMADDSGLCVDCLGGRPGIYSARYMGEDTGYDVKIAALQAEIAAAEAAAAAESVAESLAAATSDTSTNPSDHLSAKPSFSRAAQFVCAICCRRPDGSSFVVEGVMPGEIAPRVAGENGFGYDPVFFLPDYGMNSAELSPEEKNRISHRGQALRKMRAKLLEE